MRFIAILLYLFPGYMLAQKSVHFHMQTVSDVVKTDTIIIGSMRLDSVMYLRITGSDNDTVVKFYQCSYNPVIHNRVKNTVWTYLKPDQDIRAIGITYSNRFSHKIQSVTIQYNDLNDFSKTGGVSKMQILDGEIKFNRK
jgi:hypothetical protein